MIVIDSDERVSFAAANLNRLITERDLSFRKLGEMAGVPYRTIHNFARGVNDPSLSVVLKIADALDVPLDALLARPGRAARKGA